MARPIRNVLEQALRFAQEGQDHVGHIDVARLAARAQVIDLAGKAPMQHDIDPLTVVLDVLIVAHLPAIAIDRQRYVVDGVRDKQRHHLFRVLVRADVVGAPRNRGRHVEAGLVS